MSHIRMLTEHMIVLCLLIICQSINMLRPGKLFYVKLELSCQSDHKWPASAVCTQFVDSSGQVPHQRLSPQQGLEWLHCILC